MTEQNYPQTASARAPVYLELKKVMAGPDRPGAKSTLIFVFEDKQSRSYYTSLMVRSCYQTSALKALKRLMPQPPPEEPGDPDDNGVPKDDGPPVYYAHAGTQATDSDPLVEIHRG